ncbi:MAG: hypothetical protein MUE97_06010 [Phycisphaerales bacterium]|jgi:hypothetical protein|nr:hypothetical protein [Phycisphaerales bacterium]
MQVKNLGVAALIVAAGGISALGQVGTMVAERWDGTAWVNVRTWQSNVPQTGANAINLDLGRRGTDAKPCH